jgi:hypothetical protein
MINKAIIISILAHPFHKNDVAREKHAFGILPGKARIG